MHFLEPPARANNKRQSSQNGRLSIRDNRSKITWQLRLSSRQYDWTHFSFFTDRVVDEIQVQNLTKKENDQLLEYQVRRLYGDVHQYAVKTIGIL